VKLPVLSRRAAALSAAVAVLSLVPSAAAGPSPGEPGWEKDEIAVMRVRAPHAIELLEQGETLGVAGKMTEAEAAFRQAEVEAPGSVLLRRRRCEALTALGRRADAMAECIRALADAHTWVNQRALLRAMVDGPVAPSVDQIFQALAFIRLVNTVSPRTAIPALLVCEIASSTGNGPALVQCATELEKVAPGDAETLRIQSMVAALCPPARFWAGWLALLAWVLVTAGHALYGAVARGRRTAGLAAVAAIAAGLLLALPGVARADALHPAEPGMLSKWPVDDAHPEQHIPDEKARASEPLEFGYWLQDCAFKAESATKHGNHAAAIKYYAALAAAVPDRAISYSKMCDEYEALGEKDKALESCGQAILRAGARVGDYIHFVNLDLAKPGPLPEKDVVALGRVLQTLKEDRLGKDAVPELECKVGVRTSNVVQLRECTAALAASAPDGAKTVTYLWALATLEGQYDEASRLVARAGQAGVATPDLDNMRKATAAERTRHKQRILLVVLAVAVAFLAIAIPLGWKGWRKKEPASA